MHSRLGKLVKLLALRVSGLPLTKIMPKLYDSTKYLFHTLTAMIISYWMVLRRC